MKKSYFIKRLLYTTGLANSKFKGEDEYKEDITRVRIALGKGVYGGIALRLLDSMMNGNQTPAEDQEYFARVTNKSLWTNAIRSNLILGKRSEIENALFAENGAKLAGKVFNSSIAFDPSTDAKGNLSRISKESFADLKGIEVNFKAPMICKKDFMVMNSNDGLTKVLSEQITIACKRRKNQMNCYLYTGRVKEISELI